MLPVSAWPPGAPGSALSPYGLPTTVNAACFSQGYILPKGAWIVNTMANSVVQRISTVTWSSSVAQAPGTGLGVGQPPPPAGPPGTIPPGQTNPFQLPNSLDCLMAWRAIQRQVGRTDPPIRPLPGLTPPNFFGWFPSAGQVFTLLGPNSGGTVIADGQSVAIVGGGCSTIMQAYSV